MPVKKRSVGSTSPKKRSSEKQQKQFHAALSNLETAAQEWIRTSRDPQATGVKINKQLYELTARIEAEINDEAMSVTEAGYIYEMVVGVGVGVI